VYEEQKSFSYTKVWRSGDSLTKVRKRDGREEEFSKMKIVSALIKAGSSVELADKIAEECESVFGGKDYVETSEIREFVLSKLRDVDKQSYENWLRFDSRAKGLG
jgi:transcriptional regulator NrdR family protein